MTSEELNWRFVHAPKIYFYLSLALHLSIPLFFVSLAVLDKFGWSLLGPKRERREVYQEFIQVDVVGLPDQLLGQDVDTSLPLSDKAVPPPKEEPSPTPVETAAEEKGKSEPDVMAELEAKRQ